MTPESRAVLALAGGVGGAKLALGLSLCLPPGDLIVCVNTGDDEAFHGLHVSPDLDTMMYTLSGFSNKENGWGVAGDTFTALEMLGKFGVDTWFNLGDRDLATHILRTQMLSEGRTLSEVTSELNKSLGVFHEIIPMSDDPVKTVLSTDEGELPMQRYFVGRRAEPIVSEVRYRGADVADASPGLHDALTKAALLVFCPSNPYLSLGPILALPEVRQRIRTFPGKRVCVSPIVGGDAVNGPAGKIMAELGKEVSCVEVAREYRDICDVLVIDSQDRALASQVEEMGVTPLVTSTIMETEEDKIALAREILALSG
ncbi:MAG: 2-phospho-L-lactate transferase [Chloroflexota bacterium]|nr:2-phospho-L-lactate transferase [Dehalococcoidia bacterium]MEC8958955.1 2-phospho-L-lactate transferase [Chloroflexota bacterium]MEE3249115.1 2-phospho-L-lactate transferase [Chloroflexota bacterium]